MADCGVAVIGAGPYGLSVAAYLNSLQVNYRAFGSPMQTWRENMPKGMRLKSEGFASSLCEPSKKFTLGAYCAEKNIPYADLGIPVKVETFVSYGIEFQKRYVPKLEEKRVVSLRKQGKGYELKLDDGETFNAGKVVIAAGIAHFSFLPPVLSGLPQEFVTHTADHHLLEKFNGRDVIVVGGGSSAVDLAALLHQAGARVQLAARTPTIKFHTPPRKQDIHQSLFEKIRNPITGLGPGWRLFMCANGPLIFRHMPEGFRLKKVRKVLGPSTGWFVKDEVVGKVPFTLGVEIEKARIENNKIVLDLVDRTGKKTVMTGDHLIAGTGYRVDLNRLKFMDKDLIASIESVDGAPALSSYFESSVPGLYFVGTAGANTFGPLLRFAYGADFATNRVWQHLAKFYPRRTA